MGEPERGVSGKRAACIVLVFRWVFVVVAFIIVDLVCVCAYVRMCVCAYVHVWICVMCVHVHVSMCVMGVYVRAVMCFVVCAQMRV